MYTKGTLSSAHGVKCSGLEFIIYCLAVGVHLIVVILDQLEHRW